MNINNLMMHKILIFSITIFSSMLLNAQEYKVPKNTGKLVLNLSGATVVGYEGKEIVITFDTLKQTDEGLTEKNAKILDTTMTSRQISFTPPMIIRTGDEERSKGLQLMNEKGVMDNSGLGVNLVDNGNTVTVTQVSKRNVKPLLIKVPKTVAINYIYNEAINARKVVFKNIENEIEVSVNYNTIQLENVTGPMTIKSVYGDIEAVLGNLTKSPISLLSIYGFIDMSIPSSAKANLTTKSDWGDVLVSPELKIDIEKNETREVVSNWTNQQTKSKLNGGGGEISLKSTYGRIYLRSKK